MKKSIGLFGAVGFVFIFLAIQVICQKAVQMVDVAFLGGKAGQFSATGTVIFMALFSLSTIALFTLARWSPVSRHYVLTRPWDVLVWCVIAAIGAIVPSLFLQELMPQWPEAIQKYIDEAEAVAVQMMNTRGGYAVVCLLAPVAEELVFRGAVLRTLLVWQPQRRWLMIALSALLFALAHLNPAQLLHPLLIGLLLGWMYERTGSILPGVVYHWANNTMAYLMYHAYPSSDITLSDILGQQSRVLMALAFSMLILLPAIFQLHQRMRKE